MISIVIPTLNHEKTIACTIAHLKENAYTGLIKEIIVVDGGSNDNTVNEAQKAGAKVVYSVRNNIAAQMNLGVEQAIGKVVYFLTPGLLPPKHFTNHIVRAIHSGYSAGVFRVQYEYKHWLLKAVSYLSRIKKNFISVDDQSLFVMKELFVKTGSFREDMLILEDLDIVNRLRRYSSFIVLTTPLIAATAKYSGANIIRKQIARLLTQVMYGRGYSQKKILKVYEWVSGRKTNSSFSSSHVVLEKTVVNA
jgi:glycosyltransferase involved in cell wall biosynthesis